MLSQSSHTIRPDLVESARAAVLILNDEQTKSAKDQCGEDEIGYEEEFHGGVPFSIVSSISPVS